MTIDLKTAFWPAHRATSDDFWLALGVIALIDAVRLSLAPSELALFLWLVILFFVAAAHINRLRDAGRQAGLVIVPLGLGTAAKVIGGFLGMATGLMPMLIDYLEGEGVDVQSQEALQSAMQDEALMEGFQRFMLANEAQAAQALSAGAWPSMIAFWAVVFALGFWFARMRPRAA